MKGDIRPNPAILNKFLIELDGLIAFYARRAGAFESEVASAEAPDRTVHSAGEVGATEWEMETPIHHVEEAAALEAWFAQCAAGAPGYKRNGQIHALTASGVPVRTWSLSGVWVKKRSIPEMNRTTDEIAFYTWTMNADDVIAA